MSRYYGIIDGGSTLNVHRCGHTYILTKANTWTQGIKVYIKKDEKDNKKDVFEILITSGSGDRGIQKTLLTIGSDELEKLLMNNKDKVSLMDLYLGKVND